MARLIAGIDEAGRGPLAGPVTAACVVFPDDFSHDRITDSKKLTDKKRSALYGEITAAAIAYSVVSVGHCRIDSLNIRQATRVAMAYAAERVAAKLARLGFDDVLYQVDGNTLMDSNLPQETIIKGDAKVMAIGAASILAKVTRDRLMERLDSYYPGYELSKHKGYPTSLHRERVRDLGPSRVHRRTFGGVREFLTGVPPLRPRGPARTAAL